MGDMVNKDNMAGVTLNNFLGSFEGVHFRIIRREPEKLTPIAKGLADRSLEIGCDDSAASPL